MGNLIPLAAVVLAGPAIIALIFYRIGTPAVDHLALMGKE
ncbi:photosystem II reaction center protein Ycf12/Psb30 [Prochlorococcus sp. MIT 1300]|nr:photosystem II reaction center protein Ycf12 [Prochlorococcus sp. MIT 1300]